MNHQLQPILEVYVQTDPAGTVTLAGEIGTVKMIPFKGTVQGPVFTGIVEPCGVDTQITNQNEVRHMSARCSFARRMRNNCKKNENCLLLNRCKQQ